MSAWREDEFPMILGCDASGVDAEGRDVVVHAVIPSPDWSGDETLDPRRTLLSEKHQGTLAERVVVPTRNVLPKPAELSHEEAACLGTAWLTAYRMLFVKSGVRPGATVLVQGASGGVATALIALGAAAGYRMWVTGRTEAKRQAALALGADAAFEPDARLPKRVDAVMETVGEATWSHSLKSLAPGGTIVVCGATSGPNPPADLNRVFFLQLSRRRLDDGHPVGAGVADGDAGDTPASGRSSTPRCRWTGPRDGFAKIVAGDTAGKIVLTV